MGKQSFLESKISLWSEKQPNVCVLFRSRSPPPKGIARDGGSSCSHPLCVPGFSLTHIRVMGVPHTEMGGEESDEQVQSLRQGRRDCSFWRTDRAGVPAGSRCGG